MLPALFLAFPPLAALFLLPGVFGCVAVSAFASECDTLL
jgi:hypothetical protein